MDLPRTQYAKSDGVNVAYQVVGDGYIEALVAEAAPGAADDEIRAWTDVFRYSVSPGAQLDRLNGAIDVRPALAAIRVPTLAVHQTGDPWVSSSSSTTSACAASWRGSAVKDLVVGSDLRFEDRGTANLRGVPGEWRIYAVA